MTVLITKLFLKINIKLYLNQLIEQFIVTHHQIQLVIGTDNNSEYEQRYGSINHYIIYIMIGVQIPYLFSYHCRHYSPRFSKLLYFFLSLTWGWYYLYLGAGATCSAGVVWGLNVLLGVAVLYGQWNDLLQKRKSVGRIYGTPGLSFTTRVCKTLPWGVLIFRGSGLEFLESKHSCWWCRKLCPVG